ncbi:hypothetical protein [Arthrobacter sunyaminii]|uniref:hypothetical protein n=1 Tax=Arthrobacter sunyaminii TaxID=2816859 RepID=UPI001A946F10|nr:hypothetical protein [Arthrobacter sunyaminii]MBO0896479.1 hypothetical protein [Arthrobacter sunyaminii]
MQWELDNSVDQMLNEYRARLHWDRREYKAALGHATAAADEALIKEDITGYWRMTLLLAECQMELGLIQEFAASTKKLSESSALQGDQAMVARAKALYSRALESLGHIGESLVVAQEAAAIELDEPSDTVDEIEMLHGLVAALAESDKVSEAWPYALRLAALAGQQDDQHIAGKAYWAVGNVAFLNGDAENGIRFHKLAAENLAPDNDVNTWAFFNKGSAQVRLSAGIADQETLECIERAELANSVIGGSPLMELELSTARAHWLVCNNGAEEAAASVQQILDQRELLPEHEIAEVEYVAALALHDLGRNDEALAAAVHSEKVFIARGAHRRALEARSVIDSINAGSH